jgi:hypothetical protein
VRRLLPALTRDRLTMQHMRESVTRLAVFGVSVSWTCVQECLRGGLQSLGCVVGA